MTDPSNHSPSFEDCKLLKEMGFPQDQFPEDMIDAVLGPPKKVARLKCIDLFCGIGGFRVAASNLGLDVVFACDIDDDARAAYRHNFGLAPMGDIVPINAADIPDHDILMAGFPCQPFSIIGAKQGTDDPRGKLFLEILRIVRAKRPRGIVLENVKQLATAQRGGVLRHIMDELCELGYFVDYKILNALDFRRSHEPPMRRPPRQGRPSRPPTRSGRGDT